MASPLEMLGQIREVVSVSRAVDRLRSEVGPADLLTQLRQQGGTRTRRDQSARRRLHRLISVIDRLLPRPANCYRRALVEIAMDAGAAGEPLHFALRAGGGKDSGHAWLGAAPHPAGRYDATFTL